MFRLRSRRGFFPGGWSASTLLIGLDQTTRQKSAVQECSRGYFKDFSFELRDRTLILRDRVPTVQVKQLLESRLSGLDGIRKVDDRVDALSARGLSSTHRKWLPETRAIGSFAQPIVTVCYIISGRCPADFMPSFSASKTYVSEPKVWGSLPSTSDRSAFGAPPVAEGL